MLAVTLLIAAAALSALFAADKQASAIVLINWSGCALVWFVAAKGSDTARLARALLLSFGTLAILAISHMVFILITQDTLIRAQAVLFNSNVLGMIMVYALAIAAINKRWFYFYLFAVVLLLTASRASLVGAGAGALVYLLLMQVRFQIRAWMIIPLSVVLVLGLIWFQITGHGTWALRLDLWRAGLLAFIRHPLLGVGPGNFPYEFLRYAQQSHELNHFHAHNIVLQIAAETGIAGIAALLFSAHRVVTHLICSWSGSRAHTAMQAALFAAVLAASMLDYTYWSAVNLLWLGLTFIVLRSENGIDKQNQFGTSECTVDTTIFGDAPGALATYDGGSLKGFHRRKW